MPDAAAIEAAERIRSRAAAIRAHRLGQPDELTEDIMPKKASTEPKVEAKPEPKKRGRKPGVKVATKATPAETHQFLRTVKEINSEKMIAKSLRDSNANRKSKPATGPRFGVFDDGAVELRLPKCSGSLEATEARELVEFLGKLGVKA